MEKYVTSIKEYVIQALTNGKEIKKKAKENDPISCLQMGMIHLLGINTQIDFKEASTFFTNLSLADNPDAYRLLGLIAECEGNYSLAFDYYAKANSESDQASFFNKVYKEREELREFLIKNKMPQRVLNNVITTVLEEYNKKKSKLSASIKLAVICEDKQSYMEVAQNFCDEGDYSSAIYWLKKADADSNSSLYTIILNKIQEYSISLKESKEIELVEIEGNSLLLDSDVLTTFVAAINALKEIPSLCRDLWRKGVAKKVKLIKDKWEKEEKSKKEREKAEYNALLKQQEEEEAIRKKKRKRNIIISIAAIWLFLSLLVAISSSNGDGNSKEAANKEVVAADNSNTSSSGNDNGDEKNSSVNMDAGESGYNNILSERKLLDVDIEDKTKEELEIMRNSIYARYGYKFKREDLLNHFSQYSWYNPTTSDMGEIYNKMNENEKYNVDFIKKHE